MQHSVVGCTSGADIFSPSCTIHFFGHSLVCWRSQYINNLLLQLESDPPTQGMSTASKIDMEVKQCTIHFKWGVTGEELTTFTCRDDEDVGILHSYVSNWLQLGPARIALHIEDVLVPGVRLPSQNVMTITNFQHEVNISCVLLEPQHCPYCQNLFHKGTFIQGVVPYAYLYRRPEQLPPHDNRVWTCYCNQRARENGRRCHRSWWYLIRKLGKEAKLKCDVLEQFYDSDD